MLHESYDSIRNTVEWAANSRPDCVIRPISKMSTQHILNIIRNVRHVNDEMFELFSMEITGRISGRYPDVDDY